MSGLQDPAIRAVYLRGLFDDCLRDLMDGDPDLIIAGIEIPPAAGQMYIHFMANLESNGLRIKPEPEWHVFNKDEPSTWPSEGQACWISSSQDGWSHQMIAEWVGGYASFIQPGAAIQIKWSAFVTHWMPIEVPEPPQ